MTKLPEIKRRLPEIFVGASILAFAIIKLLTVHFRFSDGNAYFYMAHALWHGVLPYRDYNLADPPLLVLLLAPIKALIGSHLIVFQILPIIFDSGTAFVIYKILKSNRVRLAFLAPFIYLFSFTVMATSDYLTGGEVTVFLIALAIYLDHLKKTGWSALSWTAAMLIKVYAFPPFLGFYLYKIIRRDYRAVWKITWVSLLAAGIVLIPFIIASPGHFFYDTLLHQLNRPPGINKWKILGVFLKEEFLLLLFAAAGIYIIRNKKLLLQFFLMLGFLLAYQDLYYLYLHTLLPYIVIFAVAALEFLYLRFGKNFAVAAFALFALLLAIPMWSYAQDFYPQNLLLNTAEISASLKNAPENLKVYGSHEITPLVALQSGREILDNYIDTNTQNFAALTLDRNLTSKNAVDAGVYMVSKIINYPSLGIYEQGYEDYFDPELFKRYCKTYKVFPSTSNDIYNLTIIFRCKK